MLETGFTGAIGHFDHCGLAYVQLGLGRLEQRHPISDERLGARMLEEFAERVHVEPLSGYCRDHLFGRAIVGLEHALECAVVDESLGAPRSRLERASCRRSEPQTLELATHLDLFNQMHPSSSLKKTDGKARADGANEAIHHLFELALLLRG